MAQEAMSEPEVARQKGLVESYRTQSRWGDMAELQLKILHSHEKTLGKEDTGTLNMMHDLANTYGRMGRLRDAAELYRPLVAARRRLLGEEDLTTLKTMHYLGATCTDLGELEEAEALHRHLLPIHKRVRGLEHDDTLRTMRYLAVTCGNLGKLTEARDLYEEMLPIRRRRFGSHDANTVQMMNNLAVTYSDLGQHQEAAELYQELLVLRRALRGGEHSETLKTMHRLAVAYGDSGRLEEAVRIHVELLPLRKRLRGPENSDTLITMNHLAVAYTDLKRFQEAEELHNKLLVTRKRLLGAEHKDTLQSLYYLSATYIGLKKLTEAEKLLMETLEAFDRVLGKRHSHSMGALSYLAFIYEQLGRWRDAEMYESELLQRRQKFLGESHPSTLVSSKSLSLLLQRQGRWHESRVLEESISQLSQRSSTLQSDWQTATSGTSGSRGYLTDRVESVSSLQGVDSAALSRVLGADHPESLDSLESDAESHMKAQRWTEAETILDHVLKFRRKVQGDSHIFTIQTMSNLAWAYQGQGKLSEAIKTLECALKELDLKHETADPRLRSDMEERLSFTRGKVGDSEKSASQTILQETDGSADHGPNRSFTICTLKSSQAVITANTTVEEIMAYFTNRSCPDLTQSLDTTHPIEQVTSGGFGDIWRGTLSDGSPVALKGLWKAPGNKLNKYLARELYAWSKVQHHNVLALSGLAYFRTQLVMVSLWMEHGSINEYLRQHPDADRLDLVHSDLKAQNIFVSRDGTVKVGDFGLAALLGDHSVGFSTTSTGGPATPRWAAPELFQPHHGPNLESDVYGLGMTILEIITGRIPFSEFDNPMQVTLAVAINKQRPSLPREIVSMHEQGSKLWALLNRCWDVNPQQRPIAEQELKEIKDIAG